MTDRHILFSAAMVRALLAGTKTQTRRMFKPRGFEFYTHPVSGDRYNEYRPYRDGTWDESRISGSGTMRAFDWGESLYAYLPHAPGDRLWVKETYALVGDNPHMGNEAEACWDMRVPVYFRADDVQPELAKWRSSLFLRRSHSRLTLTITDVRVERLQDISEADAIAEGIERRAGGYSVIDEKRGMSGISESARVSYSMLWDVINGPGAWEANPWVAAYTFTVHRGNIDERGSAE